MVLGGRYALGKVIGHGGMAEVHLAEDTRLHRTVAVKILRSDLARDADFQERFRREAQAAASLNHPAIVAVYDTGEERSTSVTGVEITIPYIVMEYVEGTTLREHIDPEHPMTMQRAGAIMETLLSALEYSHRAGIVHRDIKPGNVMITPTGRVKVMDFGIARAVADATSAMTATQAVMGTAQYLSPEQARGQLVDTRSDIYSAACVMYEMLTGRPPFTGDSPVSIAYQHVREEPQPPSFFNPAISPQMDAVILTGLAKDRDHRYASAVAFTRDIAAVLAGRTPELVGGFVPAGAAAAAADGDETTVLNPVDGATEMLPVTTAPLAATTGRRRAVPPPAATSLTPRSPAPAELPPEEDEKRRRPWWLIILLLLAILGVIAAALFLLKPWDTKPSTVAVPAVAGKTEKQARTALTAAGLTGKFTREASDEVEKGDVISTDPRAGSQVAPGSNVTVVVSAGPEAVDVPDLTGKTREEAQKALADLGLEMQVKGEEDAAGAKAGTITRLSPQAGSTVAKGGTVDVWVATGNVKLPDVKGLSLEEATSTLEGVGLTVESSEREDAEHDPGTVVEQTPPGGGDTTAAVGSTVRLVVAKAVGPSTMPNLIGRSEADARKVLADNGWGAESKSEASDSVPKGQVIRTDPAAGSAVAPNSTVVLVISTGPAPTPTPTPDQPTTTTPSTDPTTPGGNGNDGGNNGNPGNNGNGRGKGPSKPGG